LLGLIVVVAVVEIVAVIDGECNMTKLNNQLVKQIGWCRKNCQIETNRKDQKEKYQDP